MVKDMTELLKDYSRGWVAFNEDESEVIAHGEDLGKVIEDAKRKGFDSPILMKIPLNWSLIIG